MSRRRDKSEIIIDILLGAFEESTKTRILHRTNISAKIFPKYMKALKDREYIASSKNQRGRTLFKTTEKGRELLNKMREFQAIVEDTRKI